MGSEYLGGKIITRIFKKLTQLSVCRLDSIASGRGLLGYDAVYFRDQRCFGGPYRLHLQGEVKWYPTKTLHGVTNRKTETCDVIKCFVR
jgi:hypothetical protein